MPATVENDPNEPDTLPVVTLPVTAKTPVASLNVNPASPPNSPSLLY